MVALSGSLVTVHTREWLCPTAGGSPGEATSAVMARETMYYCSYIHQNITILTFPGWVVKVIKLCIKCNN